MTSIDRRTILSSLRGQRLEVDNLQPIFAQWPAHRNPHWKALIPEVNKRLESLITDQRKLAKLKAADFALFAAHWWPNSGFQELRILAFLAIWLFIWDDEIDESTGSLTDDYEASVEFRRQTVVFLEQCLGLDPYSPQLIPSSSIIKSFDVIGDAIREVYDINLRQIFMAEMIFFMETSDVEQRRRLNDEIPTLEEYWACRLGTSAVGVTTVMFDFANQAPPCIPAQKARTIWDSTNLIISCTNDILSLKKEIKLGCIDSLIPLAVATHGNPQRAIDDAITYLQDLVICFDADVKQVLSHISDAKEQLAVRNFVDGCRFNCTGNLNWSLLTDRYGVKGDVQADGRVVFDLE